MDFKELIIKRRSIRDFLPHPVPMEIINEILEETCLAPTARNGQPCRFVIIKDPDWIKRLSQENKESLLEEIRENPHSPLQNYADILRDVNFNIFYNAPCLILILAPEELSSAPYDAALTAAYLMFAAANRGLGTCWIGLGAHIRREETLSLLGIPSGFRIFAPLIIGYPRNIPPALDRHAPVICKVI